MPLHSKTTVADYIWCHSRFLHSCLVQCEELYRHNMGFSCVTVLFNCLENVSRSAINDYTSKLWDVFSFLYEKKYITLKEYEFLNMGNSCLRKIRNLYAHKNVASIYFIEPCSEGEYLWPLTENETSLMLYNKISDIVFNLMVKIVSINFIDTVKARFQISLDSSIDECHLKYKILSAKELLVLKGYPEDYIPDDLDIPEDAKLRMVDCAPDLNMNLPIYSALVDFLQNEGTNSTNES